MSFLDTILSSGPADSLLTTAAPVNVSHATPPAPGMVLTAIDALNAKWQVPASATAAGSLLTATGEVDVSGSGAPAPGDVLTAVSATEAIWAPSGTASDFMPSEVTPNEPGAPGVDTALSRADHVHPVAIAEPAALVPGAVAEIGTSTALAVSDHVHELPPFGTTPGTFAEGSDPRIALLFNDLSVTSLQLGEWVILPDTSPDEGSTYVITFPEDPPVVDGSRFGIMRQHDTPYEEVHVQGYSIQGLDGHFGTDSQIHEGQYAEWTYSDYLGGWRLTLTTTGIGESHVPPDVAAIGFGQAGSSHAPARADHQHAVATSGSVASLTVGGAGTAGASALIARADHAHGMPGLATGVASGFMSSADFTKLGTVQSNAAPVSSTAPTQITVTTAAAGAATDAARRDHVHSVSTAAPTALAIGSAQNAGSATSLSRSDHVHAMPGAAAPSSLAIGGSNNAGASASFARADHVHALPTAGTPSSLTLAGSNNAGVSASLAAADHVHALPASNVTPATLSVGGAASVGVSTAIPKADHVHAMPNIATTSTDGFLSANDKLILSRMPRVNQCRISGDPNSSVMVADNAAISTIYLLPHTGATISLYVSALGIWVPFDIAAAGISLTLSGAMTPGRPFDIWCVAPASIGGTPTLEQYPWSTANVRVTALALQDGVLIKSGDPTRRYVGTIMARTASTIAYLTAGYTTTTAKCDIWNADNRVEGAFVWEPAWTGSFPVSSAGVWFLPTVGAKFEFVAGRVLDPLDSQFSAGVNSAGTANSGFVGISLNGAEQDRAARIITAAGEVSQGTAYQQSLPALGSNNLQFMLFGSTTSVVFYLTDDSGGAGGNPPLYKYGCVTRYMY
jgi:hypothetical protein